MDTMTILSLDSSLEEKAAFGAKQLDGKRPGWYREIQLDILNMRRAVTCIVGQLTGDYDQCTKVFNWDDDDAILRGLFAPCSADFNDEDAVCTCRDSYKLLDQYWTVEILNRRIAEAESA